MAQTKFGIKGGLIFMPTSIDRHEVQRLVEQDGAQLVEVLPEAEYAEAHLPGAINIPLKEFDAQSISVLNTDAPVIVY